MFDPLLEIVLIIEDDKHYGSQYHRYHILMINCETAMMIVTTNMVMKKITGRPYYLIYGHDSPYQYLSSSLDCKGLRALVFLAAKVPAERL